MHGVPAERPSSVTVEERAELEAKLARVGEEIRKWNEFHSARDVEERAKWPLKRARSTR